jgi:hypothetical protein
MSKSDRVTLVMKRSDGRKHTASFDLTTPAKPAQHMALALSGHKDVAAYAKTLTDSDLSKQLDQWIGLLLPFPWDRQSRPSIHALLLEMEARRLRAGQITLRGGRIEWEMA